MYWADRNGLKWVFRITTWGDLDRFLKEVEVAYLKYMRPYRGERYFRKMEKVKRLFSDKHL